MRTISKRKKSSGLLGWLLVFAMALATLAAGAYFGAKTGIIRIPGLSPELTEAKNIRRVAYVAEAYGAGYGVLDAVSFWTYEAEDENVLIPEDIVTESDIASGALNGFVFTHDMSANSFITFGCVCPVDTEETLNDTAREISISYIDVMANIEAGDYVDIRFRIANSDETTLRDEIVLAKKNIKAVSNGTVILELNEDEQMLLAAAGVEKTLIRNEQDSSGDATLYMTKYVSIAQRAAKITYSNDDVIRLLRNNPNLVNNPTALYEKIIGGN